MMPGRGWEAVRQDHCGGDALNARGKWSIPEMYQGIRFRSKLEVSWAKFFDGHHVQWAYEPEGFHIGNVYYLPDFYLPEIKTIGKSKAYWTPPTKRSSGRSCSRPPARESCSSSPSQGAIDCASRHRRCGRWAGRFRSVPRWRAGPSASKPTSTMRWRSSDAPSAASGTSKSPRWGGDARPADTATETVPSTLFIPDRTTGRAMTVRTAEKRG